MYFDTLATEIFPTIIKYVAMYLLKGSTPEGDQDKSAKKRDRIVTISMLFSEDGPFRNVISKLVTKVGLGSISDASCLSNGSGFFIIGPDLLESEGLELELPERIIRICGESVTNVSFSFRWSDILPEENDYNMFMQKFGSLVQMYCPNVKGLRFISLPYKHHHLPIDTIAPALVEKFSTQLRSIEWGKDLYHQYTPRFDLPDITMCSHIRELACPSSPQLISFLRASGVSLERLNVKFERDDSCAEMINTIEANCTKFSTVSFENCSTLIQTVGEERCVEFLCSLGSRLRYTEVGLLSVESLTQIVNACPSLLVSPQCVFVDTVEEWERIRVLGSTISSLGIYSGTRADKKCQKAIEKCTNLKELIVYLPFSVCRGMADSANLSLLSSLLSSSLAKFEHLNFTATQQDIAKIASAPWNLRELLLSPYTPIDIGTDLLAIVDSNPQLDSVSICERIFVRDMREKDVVLQVLRMLVKTFSKCRSICFRINHVEGRIITRDEIHDICGLVPCRGVDVEIEVGSTLYQQTRL